MTTLVISALFSTNALHCVEQRAANLPMLGEEHSHVFLSIYFCITRVFAAAFKVNLNHLCLLFKWLTPPPSSQTTQNCSH
jgi:hypothetical protein